MTTLTKLILSTLLILITLLFSSCTFNFEGINGNGEVVSEDRPIKETFTNIKAQEGLNVYVTQSTETSISVEADDNVIDYIKTDIENDVLKIHTEKNIGRATKKIYVSLPEIETLDSSSGANIVSENTITTDRIDLEASSGSDIKITIEAEKINADSSSGASITLSGNAATLVTEASSGSDIRAKELVVGEGFADASSGADITINILNSLDAEASSGGNIRYLGDPKITNKNKSVSGNISRY